MIAYGSRSEVKVREVREFIIGVESMTVSNCNNMKDNLPT